jgi:hypothetical protein
LNIALEVDMDMEECLSPEAQARLDQQMAVHEAYQEAVQKWRLAFASCCSWFDIEEEFAAA